MQVGFLRVSFHEPAGPDRLTDTESYSTVCVKPGLFSLSGCIEVLHAESVVWPAIVNSYSPLSVDSYSKLVHHKLIIDLGAGACTIR